MSPLSEVFGAYNLALEAKMLQWRYSFYPSPLLNSQSNILVAVIQSPTLHLVHPILFYLHILTTLVCLVYVLASGEVHHGKHHQ